MQPRDDCHVQRCRMFTHNTTRSLLAAMLMAANVAAMPMPTDLGHSSGTGPATLGSAQRMVTEAARSGDRQAEHAALIVLAERQSEMGMLSEALGTAFRSKDLATAIGNADAMCTSLRCISNAFRLEGRYDRSAEMARNALAITRAAKDPLASHDAYLFLVDQLLAAGHNDEARQMVVAAMEITLPPTRAWRKALARQRLGMVRLGMRHPSEAMALFNDATGLIEVHGNAQEKFDLAAGKVMAAVQLDDARTVVEQGRIARVLLSKVDKVENRRRMQELEVEVAAAEGRWPDALAIMRGIRDRQDSIHHAHMRTYDAGLNVIDELGRTSKRNADLSQRNQQHEAVIADQRARNRQLAIAAIVLLGSASVMGWLMRRVWIMNRRLKLKAMVIRRQGHEISAKNMALKQQNLRLSEALINQEEKELLIKEIHHRVKNDLQVVDSLLSIEGDGHPDQRITRQFKEAQGRIRSMALVHDHIYRSNGPGHGSLAQHLEELARNVLVMFDMHDRISVTVNGDRKSFPEDVQMPLTLLVNELLTNALKHAFPGQDTGHIQISIKSGETGHRLIFSDNGRTWSAEQKQGGNSFGLQLIGILAQQLDGTIERSHENGNTFRLSFGEVGQLRKAS